MTEWREVKIDPFVLEHYIHFKCECGNVVVIAADSLYNTSEDYKKACTKCGWTYRLTAIIEVRE